MAVKKKTKKRVTEKEVVTSGDDARLPLTSMNVVDERMEQLKSLYPEVFFEGEIDYSKLEAALGKYIENSSERSIVENQGTWHKKEN